MSAKSKQAELEQIKAEIIKNNVCPYLAKTATNLVMGDGSVDSPVVFIGEAPGKNEDLQGRPFVGAAGKFLDEMLEGIGFKRQDVYITNIVKYRPSNNRDPLPDEKSAFWPYLLRELKCICPKVIVTLGRHSMEYFMPNQRISAIHGQPKRVAFGNSKLVVLPLFHPAAALYNGSMKQTLIEDFKMIPKTLEIIKQEKVKEI